MRVRNSVSFYVCSYLCICGFYIYLYAFAFLYFYISLIFINFIRYPTLSGFARSCIKNPAHLYTVCMSSLCSVESAFFYCFHNIIPMLKCVFSAFYYRYVHKSYLFFAVAILVAIL